MLINSRYQTSIETSRIGQSVLIYKSAIASFAPPDGRKPNRAKISNSSMSPCVRPIFMIAGIALLVSLGGCALSDDRLASMMAAPGKFSLYSCPELVQRHKEIVVRQHELEGLMAKAGQESSGRLVSAMAYRPEYLSLRGEMKDALEAAAEKKCDLPDPSAMLAADNAPKPARVSPKG